MEVDLDISVAHPWSPDIISKAAKGDGAAALKRERKKHEKELWSGGTHPNFIPLVLEHFGHWSGEAEEYFNKLALESREVDGKKNVADFKNLWKQMTLQKCNS